MWSPSAWNGFGGWISSTDRVCLICAVRATRSDLTRQARPIASGLAGLWRSATPRPRPVGTGGRLPSFGRQSARRTAPSATASCAARSGASPSSSAARAAASPVPTLGPSGTPAASRSSPLISSDKRPQPHQPLARRTGRPQCTGKCDQLRLGSADRGVDLGRLTGHLQARGQRLRLGRRRDDRVAVAAANARRSSVAAASASRCPQQRGRERQTVASLRRRAAAPARARGPTASPSPRRGSMARSIPSSASACSALTGSCSRTPTAAARCRSGHR